LSWPTCRWDGSTRRHQPRTFPSRLRSDSGQFIPEREASSHLCVQAETERRETWAASFVVWEGRGWTPEELPVTPCHRRVRLVGRTSATVLMPPHTSLSELESLQISQPQKNRNYAKHPRCRRPLQRDPGLGRRRGELESKIVATPKMISPNNTFIASPETNPWSVSSMSSMSSSLLTSPVPAPAGLGVTPRRDKGQYSMAVRERAGLSSGPALRDFIEDVETTAASSSSPQPPTEVVVVVAASSTREPAPRFLSRLDRHCGGFCRLGRDGCAVPKAETDAAAKVTHGKKRTGTLTSPASENDDSDCSTGQGKKYQ
jgi:hypothetical protein